MSERRRDVAPAGCRALHGWTPRETEHAMFSMESRPDLLENAGLSLARFFVLLYPHRDKERFVSTIARGATRALLTLWWAEPLSLRGTRV
jgi:hypothetical protein